MRNSRKVGKGAGLWRQRYLATALPCYKLIAIFFSMLIITTPFSSALLDWEEEEREAQTGESIVVNVKGYEPQILPTSVVEDGDVPIYVYLTGLTPGSLLKSVAPNAVGDAGENEPLYSSIDIKQVYIRPEDEETLEYVRGSPKYIKPRQVSLENLGYLIVTLKQIDKEADVPDEIKLNMKAEITFENAERLYSMIEQDLILPERSDEAAWRQDENFNDYQFFAGRGAIRATSIGDGSAELTVYGGQDLQWPFTGTPRPLEDLELNEGETSDPIRMSAASDFMTNAFRVKLTDIIDSAKERARIRVNVNGDEKEYIVTEGSRLYPGSSLTVTEINVVRNTRTSRVTYEIVVKGPRDTSRVSKTFFERIAGGAAGILDYASETDAETGSSGGAVSSAAGTGGASFIIMSDMHTIAGTNAGIRTKAVEAVKRINPPFVILTGDIVGGEPTKYNQDGTIKSEGTTKPQADAMWSLFERETGKPLRDAGIEMFAIPGNHDLDTNALTEAYTHYWDSHKPATPVSGKYPLYYSFDYGSQHFVMLKANRRDIGAEQTSWLEEDLRKAKQEGKASLVFSHYSLEAMKKACPGGTGQSDELANNAELKTLFRENNVAAFFHGDVHFFYEGTTDGVNVVAVGPLGSKQCKIPETETDAPYMVVVANANGMNVETYGLKYPDYTERFDESLFSDNVPGYTAWRQGEVSAQAGAASTSENACSSIDGICATRCEDGRERTDSVAANNKCNEGASPAGSMMCCIPSEADASTAETQNTCEIAATDREKVGTCRSNEESCKQGEVKTVGAFSLGGERADVTCGDAGLQCCMTKVNAETSTCEEAASSKGKTGTCRTVDETCKQGETKTVGAFSLGGERADITCGDAGLQCCMTTIGDESCTAHGGKCADKSEFDCYTNVEYTQTRDFERLKCMSRPSDSNYVCCPSGFVKEKEVVSSDETSEEISPAPRTAAPTIAAGAGEGICKNKVLVFREGDTPEQWLEIIKSSTQEMVYCTAAEEFKRVAELYFGIKDEKGALYEDRANFKLGEIYYWLGDTETALKYFRLAIKNNIGEFIPLAKSRITELEEDAALHTRHKIGEFEDNGVSIRVMVLDMPFQNEEQPSATIEVEAEGTKKLNVGNGLFSRDITETGEDDVSRQYNWLVRDISSESVIIEKKYRAAPPRGYRALVKALPLNSDVRLDYSSSYRTAKLKSVDLKKYAIVTVIPGTGAPLVSNTNFSIHIPIEKRAIQWTPDEISDKINSTQAAIEDLDEVITTLSDVVTVWKKVCLVTFAYLTLKNSFFSGMSRTQARRLAMHGPDGTSGWDAYCRQNSGEGSMYEDYNECVIDNSDAIEATIDESQDAVETVNDEMENYRDQPWYRNLTKDYADLQQYEDYMGDDLYSPEQLRDYRYWQLMRQSSEYTSLNGEPSGEGYEYNLRSEVDSRISSMRLENTDKLDAYLGAVSDIDAHYENFGTLSEQDKAVLFSDLYESHLAEPDARSGDFPLIETIGVTPLSTIRREGRQLYSNTPHGRITLQEATVSDYQKGLADATSTESPRYLEGMTPELKEQFIEESQRVEAAYEGNPNAPLRTNQGNVYVDGEGRLYVAMTTAYSTAEQNPTYSPQATGEFYPDGKPYCIPTCNGGNYVKVLDFYQDGSPSVIQQWNIGTDGLLCTDDDILVQHQSMLERPESESLHRRLIEQATSIGKHSEGQVLSMCGRDFGVSTSRANTDASRSSATCYDVMDPDDCRMLFGVCDPVMCPPSRFNLGGAWQVNDVVQTGLIGSIVLGLHNFDIPYEPVPICLTGVLAGLQNIKSVLRGYVECLKTAQVQGVSVGICDKIRSVFICELIWKEAMAIINMKGGIFNWISQTFMGEEQGGGEYLTFESSIQNVEDSVSFFTSEYATSAFASYESRSTAEIGTEICKQAIFGKVPAFGEFFDELAQPESPPQYTAIVDQTGYSETQQLTRYGVFYHIYAGEDNPATYSVFLKNSITNDVHYATERCEGRQGSIEKGGIASFNLDCIAPNGYDNVCITLNGNTECGFGKVSTDFALDYLSDMIVQDETQRQIKSEEDCIASTPRTSPTLGSIPLPSSSGLLSSGVQRVCSLPNPGQGTNPTDWREVGTCGKDSTGRSMGKCWIDMRTVSINDADRMKEVSDALDETGFRSLREEMGIDVLEYEESMEELRSIEKIGTDTCDGMTNAMSAYKYLETRTITPKISAEAGYKYAELMDKAARDCAQKDPKREFTRLLDRFEYDLEALYFIFLDEFEADVAPYMASSELPADFVEEYQQKVTELYDVYKNNLTELRSTLTVDEGVYSQYSEKFETLYNTANSMQEPFVFKVEVSEEDLSQQIQIEENKCNECSSGISGVICRKPACHENGACYVEYKVGDVLGELGTLNKCHACAKLTSCSQLKDDKDMCNNQACTDMAKNGEGMSCAYRVVNGQAQCVEAERRATSTTLGSDAIGSSDADTILMNLGCSVPGDANIRSYMNKMNTLEAGGKSYRQIIQDSTPNANMAGVLSGLIIWESSFDTNSETRGHVGLTQLGSPEAIAYGACDPAGCGSGDYRRDPLKSIPAGYKHIEEKIRTTNGRCGAQLSQNENDKIGVALLAYNAGELVACNAVLATGKTGPSISEVLAKVDEPLLRAAYCARGQDCGPGSDPNAVSRNGLTLADRTQKAKNIKCYVPQILYYGDKFTPFFGGASSGASESGSSGSATSSSSAAAGSVVFTTAAAASESNIVDYGDYMQLRGSRGSDIQTMKQIVAQPEPSFIPSGQPTFRSGVIDASSTGYYYPSCEPGETWETFYQEVQRQGDGICNGKLYFKSGISTEPNTGGVPLTEELTVMKTNTEKGRTIAVNSRAGSQCFIPYGSRVYIKFQGNTPLSGWYVAEDAVGRSDTCSIRIFAGVGQADINNFRENMQGAGSASVWIYPPRSGSGAPTAGASQAITGSMTVGAIGDSITKDGRYLAYLKDHCSSAGVSFTNHGIDSDRTSGTACRYSPCMRARFNEDIIANNYDDVIIMGGVNNICDRNSVNTIKDDLTDMYERAKAAGMRVIALTITPWKGNPEWTTTCQANQEEVNRWIMEDSEADVKVDVYSVLNDPADPGRMKREYAASSSRTADGKDWLHPGATGQRLMGEAVFNAAYRSICTAS